jgi:hypothetical protein
MTDERTRQYLRQLANANTNVNPMEQLNQEALNWWLREGQAKEEQRKRLAGKITPKDIRARIIGD